MIDRTDKHPKRDDRNRCDRSGKPMDKMINPKKTGGRSQRAVDVITK